MRSQLSKKKRAVLLILAVCLVLAGVYFRPRTLSDILGGDLGAEGVSVRVSATVYGDQGLTAAPAPDAAETARLQAALAELRLSGPVPAQRAYLNVEADVVFSAVFPKREETSAGALIEMTKTEDRVYITVNGHRYLIVSGQEDLADALTAVAS